jgi:predicted nuclease of restriction endonuclease-like (RecB) superfamily
MDHASEIGSFDVSESEDYADLLATVRTCIRTAQANALSVVNGQAVPDEHSICDKIKERRESGDAPSGFSFLGLDQTASERQVEMGLIAQVGLMITELGDGFSFYRQQYTFTEGDQDFRIDLLFYHVRLKCFVVVELKVDAFRPEYAGKLTFYVSSIDDIERREDDNPTIGILLCPKHNPVIVERSVRGQAKPLHVSG